MGPGLRRDDSWGEFARTRRKAISPSLPRRDDLDLVAVLERRLCPLGSRQHVVIQRDRKMRAFIFKLGQQRVDAPGGDLPRLAVDDHAHCITSLSITPR